MLHGTTTMVRLQLDERQWRKVELALAAQRRRGRRGRNDRSFVEAVLWWRRTGAPWRDLPSDFGPWKTVFNRFDRWARTGVWGRLLAALSQDRDDEWHSIDSTINRAHQHAAGGKGGPPPMRSAVHAAGCRPRFTWWSMLWDCLSSSRSPKASDTIVEPPAYSFSERIRAASWRTRPTTPTHFEPLWSSGTVCPSSRPTPAELGKFRMTRSCTRPAPRSNARSTCSSRRDALPPATKRRSATMRPLSHSAVRCSGYEFEPSSQLCANLISMDTTRTSMPLAVLWPASSKSFSRAHTSKRAADSVADPLAVR